MPRTAATEDSAERTVSPKQLVALIREASNKKSKIATLAGELGERVKNACENAHLHRGAYALSVKLFRMEEQKREDFIRQAMLYIEICRESGLYEQHAGDLFDENTSDAMDAEAEEAAGEREAGEGREVPLSEAAAAVQAGIKQLKPRKRGRPRKSALEGADATSGTRVN